MASSSSGSFSEDETFLLSDFTAHIPREVLVKNFPGFNNSDFDKFPAEELYIFPAQPAAASVEQDRPGVALSFKSYSSH